MNRYRMAYPYGIEAADDGNYVKYEELAERDATIARLRTRNEQLEAKIEVATGALKEFDVDEPIGVGWQWQESIRKARDVYRLLADEQPADAGERG